MSSEGSTVTKLLEAIERQSNAIEALERRLEELESGNRGGTSALSRVVADQVDPGDDSRSISRRSILRLVGATAVGALATVVADSTPAAAANGSSVIIGDAANSGTAMTVLTNSGGINNTAVGGFKAIGASGSNGVIGQSSGSTSAGVAGLSDTGYGIYGESTSGYGLFSGGNGRIGLSAHTASGAPTAGTYAAGDIIRDGSGNLFACVTAGTPGIWRKLAGPSTAGQFHPISPSRIALSQISTGAIQTISTSSFAGAGATAIALSISIINTEGGSGSYLSLYPSHIPWPGTSNINWFATGQNLASFALVSLSPSGQFNVTCGGGGSTIYALDAAGYFI